jgi:endonuclease-3
MTKSETSKLINILKKTYPDAKCSLDFQTPFELVVAVMLSAQCTDERVNLTTPALFKRCKSIEDFANIDIKELEDLIHPCGFYRNKAANIKKCAKQILEDFGGEVPQDMDSLLKLAGVGRKSANVILLEVFGIANGIAVDTHCKRLSNRIGLSNQSDPSKIEQDLLKQIDKKYLKDVNHLFIWHGRYTCTARSPKCNECTIKEFCKFYKDKEKAGQ